MKKLMVMLSAAAMSFGLFAADEGFKAGDGFESATAESAFTPSDPWSQGGSTAGTFTVKAYGAGEAYTGDVPAQYADDEANNNYLKVATKFGNPLLLNVPSAAQTVGDGLYFDSLVKFTACDYEDDPTAEDAKLLVYLKETDAEGTETHIYVKAGQMTGVSTVAPAVYDCGAWSKGDDWVRLTVRAIADATGSELVPAFVVFVDGEPIGTQTAVGDAAFVAALTPAAADWNMKFGVHSLFPSLSVGEAAKVVSVGFDGQGSIDDVAVTTTQPTFAKDSDFLTITWDPAQVDVTVEGEPVSGGTYNHPFTGSMTDEQTVSVVATPKEGYAITGTTPTGCSYENDTVTIPAESFTPTLAIASKLNKPVMSITIDDDPAGTPSSFADAVAIINDNGIREGAVIRISLTDDVTVGVEDDYSEAYINSKGIVTLDLAGKTITGEGETTMDSVISANSPLTIIDTVGGGKICIAEDSSFNGAVYAAADLTIGNTDTDKGATFDALVDAYADSNIIKGFFAQESMEGLTIAEGSECSPEKVEGYWVVAPIVKKGWAIYLAQDTDGAFLIQDAGDLLDLATNLNKTADFATEGITFKQTDDIDLAGIAWEGIGAYVGENSADNNMFCGIYDGNEMEVKNITFAKKEYNGLFGNLGGEAQIKDLMITVAGFADGDATSYGFGAAAGYAMGTNVLLENITVNPAVDCQDSICGTHNMGGIGARLAGKITLKDCTNNLDISTTYSKIGGMCAIASQRDAVGAIEFNGCVNNGEITGVGLSKANTEAGSDGCAGILGYIQDGSSTDPKAGNKPVSFINCVNNGTLQHTGETGTTKACIASILGKAGGQVYQTVDGNSAKADYLSVASGTAPDGLKFATVNGGVATFGATPALDGEYKVMAAGAAYEFTEVGLITFDNSLVPTFAPTTDTTKFTLTNDGYVWTCAEKPAGPTSDEGEIGDVDPSTDIAPFTPSDPEAKEVTVALNGFTGRVSFPGTIETIKGVPANQIIVLNSNGHSIDASAFVGGDDKGYSTALTDAAQKPAFATTTEGETAEKPFVVGDETVALGVQTINGLIYQLQAEATLDNSWTAAGEPVEGNGQPMTFSTGKTDAPAQFYSIKVSK